MPHRHLVDDPEFWRSRAEEVRVIGELWDPSLGLALHQLGGEGFAVDASLIVADGDALYGVRS